MAGATGRKVAILGAGEMGHGLATLFAVHGYEVSLRDIRQEFLDRAMERIRWSLEKLHGKGRSAPPDQVLGRIHPTLDLPTAVKDAFLIVEAVPEDPGLKAKVLREASSLAPKDAVIASNTSGLPITPLGEATGRPERVLGMHFFNPPVLMDLVEVVRGEKTSDGALQVAVEVARSLGKTPVVCHKDSPGFITTRILAHYFREAFLLHAAGTPKETIDAAMRFTAGFPMGPFELADQVGLDLLSQAMKAQGLEPPAPLGTAVAEGRHGRKVGRGFYDYGAGRPALRPEEAAAFDPLRILAPMANEAAKVVEEGIASPEEVDLAMRLGTAFPKGPLAFADDVGLDKVLSALRETDQEPSRLLLGKVEKGERGKATGKGFYVHGDGGEVAEYETIKVERVQDGRVAVLTLNRPERLNTINPAMVEEISRALTDLARKADLRVLVLRGAGPKAFCAGADVTSFGGADRAYKVWQFSRRTHEVFAQLEAFPTPTLAVIHGHCLGGGCELALACDFRVASTSATLGQTEVRLGLIPGAGGTQRLVALVGLAKAKELVLLGKRLNGDEGAAMGLVHRAVEPGELERAAEEYIQGLAKGPPVALRLAKQLLNAAGAAGASGLTMEAMAFGLVASTEDLFEGIQAFLEKREPDFKGA